MSDTLASILKQAEAHGILQRKVVKGGETEYLPTHPGEASTANKWSPNQPRDEMGRFGSGGGVSQANSFENMGDAQSWGTSSFDGWRKSLSPDEVDALDMYAASKYTLVNGTLRGQIESTGPRGDLAKNLTAKMDSALDKDGLEEDVTVYRRMGRRFSDLDLQPGDVIQDNGFVSTSLLQEPLQEHFRGSVAKISVPKGIKAAYLGFADERMGVAKEQELVLQRGLKLRVKNYDPNGVSELEVLGV